MDSKESVGIQSADLIVSGVRRCLRAGFSNNEKAAACLGKLMLQAVNNAPPINLVAFGVEMPLPNETARFVKIMAANNRQMIK